MVINAKGGVVVDKISDQIGEYKEGLAVVKKGELWGYIDVNGKEVIPTIYESSTDFEEGLGVVQLLTVNTFTLTSKEICLANK